MEYKAILEQLESLKKNSESMASCEDADPIWGMDVEALEEAIKIIKEHESKERQNMERVSPITKKALKIIEQKKEYSGEIEELIARVEAYVDSREERNRIDLSKEELNMISCALAYRKKQNDSDIAKMEKALECGSESGDLSSHGEKEILQGCVRLLCEAGEHFREYLEYIGAEPDEEIPLSIQMQYGHIVKHLFLWNTYHSGGTSTRAKCRELGVEFDDEVEIIENEDDDQ